VDWDLDFRDFVSQVSADQFYFQKMMFILPFMMNCILFSSITSASNLVKYLTRFTDEIFSTLISFIFVVEAAQNIGKSFTNPASSFTKGLLTLVVAVSTYFTANTLRGLRSAVYFTEGIRKNISNFGPTIGVVAGALIARWARLSQGAAATLPALSIPSTFATTSGRPW
jgi:hypothetical protein